MSLQLTTNEATVITQFVYGLDPRGRAAAFEVKDENTIIHKLSIAHLCPDFGSSQMNAGLVRLVKEGYYGPDCKPGCCGTPLAADEDLIFERVEEWIHENAEELFRIIYEDYVEHGGTLTTDFMLNDETLFWDVADDYPSIINNNAALTKSLKEALNGLPYFTMRALQAWTRSKAAEFVHLKDPLTGAVKVYDVKDEDTIWRMCELGHNDPDFDGEDLVEDEQTTAVEDAVEAAQAAARMASLYAAQAEVVSTEGVRDPLKEAQEHNARIKETLGLV